ncbi:MAG: hypothetical protein GY862_10825 [Gammaproteobacteria bacterium]|nr:hypothetical protein [Gammaproteobacteria bacterium]
MKRTCNLILLCLAFVVGVGCANTASNEMDIDDEDLVSKSHEAADKLVNRIEQGTWQNNRPLRFEVNQNRPIIAASFVNIDNVQHSSTFGRMISEQIASRFSQRGYQIIELKLRSSIFIKQKTGELMLSRELKDISLEHDAQAIIAGTYAPAQNVVYVTAKIIRATDGIVIDSFDYRLPIGPNTRQLLGKKRRSR